MTEDINISLLWPPQYYRHNDSKAHKLLTRKLPDKFIIDLNIDMVARAICSHNYNYARDVLVELCENTDVIQYRLDIIDDLVNVPDLERCIASIIPFIFKIARNSGAQGLVLETLGQLADRVDIINDYTQCIDRLYEFYCIYMKDIKSEGLHQLFKAISEIKNSEVYTSLTEGISDIKYKLSDVKSITIGINLDDKKVPCEAVLLSVSADTFKEKSFINKILGSRDSEYNKHGISDFHKLSRKDAYMSLEEALFRDLRGLVNNILQDLKNSLAHYTKIKTEFLVRLEPELSYYVGAARLIKQLRDRGLKMCKPGVLSAESREYRVKDSADFIYALKLFEANEQVNLEDIIVTNDVNMDDDGRIFILTGPNQGGKTTYTRAAGISQLMFQAGLFIPGTEAEISPVDWVYTHFPEEEKVGYLAGKLAEECKLFNDIFKTATSQSLLLLNESLASTSFSESLHLADEITRSMRFLGCRAIFATHLHELGEKVDVINAEVIGDSRLVSMVAGIIPEEKKPYGKNNNRRSYKIVKQPPQGLSFARDIARKHGVSFDQITRLINDRKID